MNNVVRIEVQINLIFKLCVDILFLTLNKLQCRIMNFNFDKCASSAAFLQVCNTFLELGQPGKERLEITEVEKEGQTVYEPTLNAAPAGFYWLISRLYKKKPERIKTIANYVSHFFSVNAKYIKKNKDTIETLTLHFSGNHKISSKIHNAFKTSLTQTTQEQNKETQTEQPIKITCQNNESVLCHAKYASNLNPNLAIFNAYPKKYVSLFLDLLQNNKLKTKLLLEDFLWLYWVSDANKSKEVRSFCLSKIKALFKSDPRSAFTALDSFMEQKKILQSNNSILEDLICDCICTHKPEAISHKDAAAFAEKMQNKILQGECLDGIAETLLAECYLHGFGVSKDEALAKELMETASLYNSRAQFLLGLFYQQGAAGVEKNPKKAFELYLKAVAPTPTNSGYIPANELIGYCYENGEGVKKDLENALFSYQAAAEFDRPYALYKAASFLFQGLPHLKSDQKKALTYLKKAAAQNDPDACCALGIYYFDHFNQYVLFNHPISKRIKPNPVIALKYFKIAAEQGNLDAQWRLAVCLLEGTEGVESTKEQAFPWVLKVAESGSDIAQFQAGLMYANGTGTPINFEAARLWLTTVFDNKNASLKIKEKAGALLLEIT